MKALIKYIFFSIWKLFRPRRVPLNLFLMAHPRSGSSLLMHILTTNKDIIGFGEYLTKYTNSKAFLIASFDIRRKTKHLFKKVDFIANQINHPSHTPNIDLLIEKKVQLIFLIRKPEETLSSMVNFSKLRKQHMDKETLKGFYIERLNHLTLLAENIPSKNWVFITYEDLIENSNSSLEKLTSFLNLSAPLTAKYKLQKYTQVWGDTSKNITEGQLFKTASEQIQFSEEFLKPAREAYQKTFNTLNNGSFNS